MIVGDKFKLGYCQNFTFKLKRIDKTTLIHTFEMPDGSEFSRKHTEVNEQKNDWIKIN